MSKEKMTMEEIPRLQYGEVLQHREDHDRYFFVEKVVVNHEAVIGIHFDVALEGWERSVHHYEGIWLHWKKQGRIDQWFGRVKLWCIKRMADKEGL